MQNKRLRSIFLPFRAKKLPVNKNVFTFLIQFAILKAQKNKVSAQIPQLKKQGLPVDEIFNEMRTLGDKIAESDVKIKELEDKVFDLLSRMPNIPDEDLLAGEKENNKVIKEVGKKPEFSFPKIGRAHV